MNIHDAIAHFGGPSALAKSIGVSRQTVHRWFKSNEMPVQYQALIELQTTLKPLRADLGEMHEQDAKN